MKKIELRCEFCGRTFQRYLKYHKANSKRNEHIFCGSSCNARFNNIIKGYNQDPNPENIALDNILSPFKKYVRTSKRRCTALLKFNRTLDHNIDAEYLHNVWKKQNGICPFTGWKLNLPNKGMDQFELKKTNNASLDRIDDSKGYIKGNVRFIALIANYARNGFSDNELIEFCKAVSDNHNER